MPSTTNKLKILAEMTADAEFIQELEHLESGAPAAGTGINRPLGQLAENTDALLDVLTAVRSTFITGGGSIAWDEPSGMLSWSTAITIRFVHEISTGLSNVIASSTALLSASGELAYVKLDRATTGAFLTVTVAPSLAAFLAVVSASPDRQDFQILAYRDGLNVILWDGRRIRDGFALINNGYRDTQYGQQSELTLVHDNQKENFKLILSGGGNIAWDATGVSPTVGRLTWDQSLVVNFPQDVGENLIESVPVLGKFKVDLADGDVGYVTLSRQPVGSVTLSAAVAVSGASVLSGDNIFVFVKRDGDRVYLWNGTALSDGETVLLGGVRSGVQWFYNESGTGVQVTSFGSINEYTARTGELMVYRNGVKARSSKAVWVGIFPAGTLDTSGGSLDDDDHYVEEDRGDGTGFRIIWLRDNSGDALGHPTGVHAPADPFTWPDTDDWLEAFVGIQGEGPSPVESLGILGETSVLEGAVKLKAGTNVTLTYDTVNNAIEIALSLSSGVTTFEVSGGTQGAQTGALLLVPGTGISLDDTTPGAVVVDLDAALDDLNGVSSDLADAILAAFEPDAGNPVATLDDVGQMRGFELVWTPDAATIRTSGGQIIKNGVLFKSVNDKIDTDIADVVTSETISNDDWAYLYLDEGLSPGDPPVGKLSSTPPDGGKHPTEGLIFLSSVRVDGAGDFHAFVKRGSFVRLSTPLDVASGSGLSLTASPLSYSSVPMMSLLPASGTLSVELQLDLTTATAGEVQINVRTPGFSQRTLYASARTAGDKVSFVFEVLIDPDGNIEISATSAEFSSIDSLLVLGYAEGRYSATEDVWT